MAEVNRRRSSSNSAAAAAGLAGLGGAQAPGGRPSARHLRPAAAQEPDAADLGRGDAAAAAAGHAAAPQRAEGRAGRRR